MKKFWILPLFSLIVACGTATEEAPEETPTEVARTENEVAPTEVETTSSDTTAVIETENDSTSNGNHEVDGHEGHEGHEGHGDNH